MNNRPILSIPMTKVEKAFKILSVLMIVMLFGYIIYIWNDLPEIIPTHFNGAGSVDGWGGKGSLWMLPIIGFLLFMFLSFLERFPQIFNYPVMITEENSPKLYLESRRMLVILNFEITFFLSYISWGIVQAAYGHDAIGGWGILIFIIVILSTIGISIYRLFRMR